MTRLFLFTSAILLIAAHPARGQDTQPALGAERVFPELGIAMRLPEGLDPGKPQRIDFLGNAGLGFYFGPEGREAVSVSVETFAAFGDLKAFCRRRIAEAPKAGDPPHQRDFAAQGFDAGERIDFAKDAGGAASILVALRKGRTITSVTLKIAADAGDFAAQAEAVLSSLRETAGGQRPLAVEEGFGTVESANFEACTDAPKDVAQAFLSVLEAGLGQARKRFPSAKTSPFKRPAVFFADAQAFAAFKEKHGLVFEQSCGLVAGQRVLVAGVLPFGKQSRRFAKAEIDVPDAVRSVFDLFCLEAAGSSPESWFTDGVGYLIGLSLGSDLECSERRAEDELGVALAPAFKTGKVLPLEKLFELKTLDEDSRSLAAAWALFLSARKTRSGAKILEIYLENFARGWDGQSARNEAFKGESVKAMTKTLAGRIAFFASRAKRGG